MLRKFFSKRCLIAAAGIALVALVFFAAYAHRFLAVNRPVKADTLVVEGWVPDYIAAQAAREFLAGQYKVVFVSGMAFEPGHPRHAQGSDASVVSDWLSDHGVTPNKIVICPVSAPAFNRTSHMARGVRDRMHTLRYSPQGINVVTLGPHARQSLLAYQRIFGGSTPVGVISCPKNDYDPDRWWASHAGIAKTTKDFAGWLKELLFGLRS